MYEEYLRIHHEWVGVGVGVGLLGDFDFVPDGSLTSSPPPPRWVFDANLRHPPRQSSGFSLALVLQPGPSAS